jgi:large subunit ribosomal protein L21
MKYAIVENGGKQFVAIEGSTIDVDRLNVEIGEQFDLENVLLIVDGETITIGTPRVNNAKVSTTIVEHIKGPKVVIFKYRPKKHFRVKTGHRQRYTTLKIESILAE